VNLTMVLFTMVNGIKMGFVKGEEPRSGKTVVSMLGTGRLIKRTARDD